MILASQYMSDAHIGVVHRIAKEERSCPISTPDDKVTDVIGEETLRTVNKIHELDAASEWDPEPGGRRQTLE